MSCDTLGSRQRPGGRRRQRCCVWHRSGLVDWDELLWWWIVRASSGFDASFASVDWPETMADHVWIVGGSAGGGTGPAVARGHSWQ